MGRGSVTALLVAVTHGPTGCGRAQEPDEGGCGLAGPTCERNTLVTCGDAGLLKTACDPGRCAFDAPVPQCVPSGALPCRPEGTPATCENGLLVTCTVETAYLIATDCGPGRICSESARLAQCVDLAEESCSPTSFQALCAGDRRVECDPGTGRLVEAGRCAAN